VTTARIDVNGRPAVADDLEHPALVNFGHFTSMQVRRGRVRGLDLHLRRLTEATRELFDTDLDPDQVRAYVRRALDQTALASVRVNVFAPAPDGPVSVLVAIRPAIDMPDTARRLLSVPYQRPVPHLKHVGSFGQIYYGRLAVRQGYDDALLTDPSGAISETSVANIGFFENARTDLARTDDVEVSWPEAPCLAGITMQLLVDAGLPGRRRPVALADLPSFAGAFVANANGIAPVQRIDDVTLPVDDRLMRTVTERYDASPWELI
jgi:branched-subunit amino acid aminotransferase/4-amino-4-deoxychorismate lyase